MSTRKRKSTTATPAATPRRSSPSVRQERLPAAVLQLALDAAIADAGLPEATPEYPFAWATLRRKWRIDRAWPDPQYKIALEIEGGIHMRGRHIRPEGFVRDMEKYNRLSLWGWCLIRVTYDMIADGSALTLVAEAFALRAQQSA